MRLLVVALLACAWALAADSPFLGTWTINKTKSEFGGRKIDNSTIQYVQDGPTLKAIMSTNGTAEPAIAIDGKEHIVTSQTRMGATHATATAKGQIIETTFKKDGKHVGTRKFSLSAAGKILTVATDGITPDGQKIQWTAVFDKQ